MRILIGKTRLCFGSACQRLRVDKGLYWDNIAFALIDGNPAQLTISIWDWLNDAFPASNPLFRPLQGSIRRAHVMTGLNIAQSTNNGLRFDVPGDSVLVEPDHGAWTWCSVFCRDPAIRRSAVGLSGAAHQTPNVRTHVVKVTTRSGVSTRSPQARLPPERGRSASRCSGRLGSQRVEQRALRHPGSQPDVPEQERSRWTARPDRLDVDLPRVGSST